MKAVAGEELMRNTKYKRLKNTPQSWPLKKKKKKKYCLRGYHHRISQQAISVLDLL